MLLLPSRRQRASVHQHNYERLARRGDSADQRFFSLRYVEAGSIATFKARLAYRHFLAFERARDTHHGDNHVRLPRGRDRRWIGRVIDRRPEELSGDIRARAVLVGDVDLDRLASFEVNSPDAGPAIGLRDHAVGDADPGGAAGLDADPVVTGARRIQKT